MLKVIDGLRTYDHANAKTEIPSQSINGTAVNSAGSLDMADHRELIAVALAGAVTGTGVLTVQIQESNEAAANFTNVTNAVLTLNTANTLKLHSVDWRKPARKRYARLQANTTNAVVVSAFSLAVGPKRLVSLADNAGQLDA